MLRQARRSGIEGVSTADLPDNEDFDRDTAKAVPVDKGTSGLSGEAISLQQLLYRLRKDAAAQKKGKRENFKEMPAFQRCLERAGMISDVTSQGPETEDPSKADRADPHKEFRSLFFALCTVVQDERGTRML